MLKTQLEIDIEGAQVQPELNDNGFVYVDCPRCPYTFEARMVSEVMRELMGHMNYAHTKRSRGH